MKTGAVNHHNVPFTVCDTSLWANPDICLLSDVEKQLYVHLVVEENKADSFGDTRLVANAIVVAQANNFARSGEILPRKDMVILGMLMIGMRPVSYRIPVSWELAEAAMGGSYPAHETIEQVLIL
ncbi:hypothetical protein H2248_007610 [Termitomyces sp. 'cryptogamus']|nr:hypothetical protein H2248_007610 [Termitomyces sp. 'cryptogamus']